MEKLNLVLERFKKTFTSWALWAIITYVLNNKNKSKRRRAMERKKFVEIANAIIEMKDLYESGGELPDYISYEEVDRLEDILAPILMKMKN